LSTLSFSSVRNLQILFFEPITTRKITKQQNAWTLKRQVIPRVHEKAGYMRSYRVFTRSSKRRPNIELAQ